MKLFVKRMSAISILLLLPCFVLAAPTAVTQEFRFLVKNDTKSVIQYQSNTNSLLPAVNNINKGQTAKFKDAQPKAGDRVIFFRPAASGGTPVAIAEIRYDNSGVCLGSETKYAKVSIENQRKFLCVVTLTTNLQDEMSTQ